MNNLLKATLLGASLFAGSVSAAPIYVEATDVEALATINYDADLAMSWWGSYIDAGDNAPVFTFDVTSGSFSHNLGMYSAGDYTIDFLLEGLWVDIDNDGMADLTQAAFGPDPFAISTGPTTLGPLPPLAGSDGALSWNLDIPGSSLWLSYDFDSVFDSSSWDNDEVNFMLALTDLMASGSVNGAMDAVVGWDKLRVELNPVAVPEPSIWLLLGTGLLGLGWARRKA